MENNFAVFILSYGRPKSILTLKTLQKCGYEGRVYIICSDDDNKLSEYIALHGNMVITFHKEDYVGSFDKVNSFADDKIVVYARNACFGIAQKMGIDYFLQLDDDYYEMNYKFIGTKGVPMPKKIDILFDRVIGYLESSNASAIAFSQTGDFIGGIDNGKGLYRFSKRKCMNSFFCCANRPFEFIGSINEDVNSYTALAHRGLLFLTIPVIAINQKDTQQQNGGLTTTYLEQGTYIKSFTTVIVHPSGVKASMMNANHKRIHHSISWSNTTPMIISEKYKK